MKTIIPLFLLLLLSTQACQYAQSNVQTLITYDCGKTWKVIKVGESVPKNLTNYCYRIVQIPDYPMQGESAFKALFKDNVLATIKVDYDYEITDALAFIKEAKYLAKASTATSDDSGESKLFEQAENSVIDKRIKEMVGNLLQNSDVVSFDQSDFENLLLPKINTALTPLGITLNFLQFVPEFGEQTKQSIDVAVAMKIYKAYNLEDLGKSVIVAKAGAPKVVMETAPQQAPEKKAD
jgi:hypothetical protein